LKYNGGSSLIASVVVDMISAGLKEKHADGSPHADGFVFGFVTELADHIKYFHGEMLRVA